MNTKSKALFHHLLCGSLVNCWWSSGTSCPPKSLTLSRSPVLFFLIEIRTFTQILRFCYLALNYIGETGSINNCHFPNFH
jgi:hypothetical protein